MDYFPAFLDLDGKSVLLVGAGKVAARKAGRLLAAGARLTVVAPELGDGVKEMVRAGNVEVRQRRFRPRDVSGHWLVVSATNDPAVEGAVAGAADRARVFCNAVDDPDNCSYITPAIVDRSPLLVAISSSGAAPVLARRVRARVEAMLPKNIASLTALAGRWRTAVTASLQSFRDRLRFWETVFDGPVSRLALTGDLDGAEREIDRLLAAHSAGSEVEQSGEAWLVGAGPGDPGLLTLKALQALSNADVILHDRLVSSDVLDLARRDAEFISVGKAPGCTSPSQEAINELLVEKVAAGNRVCRIKGGDPFVFGRGGEEAEALAAAGLPYTVVPGITAAAGCAAAAGIPLTHRDHAQSVVLLTGHGKDSIDTLDWASLARDRQTLAVYMGVRRFGEIMQKLTDHGRSAETPIAIIERGTRNDQRVTRGRLGQLTLLASANKVRSPAILIIGEVAALGAETGVDAAASAPTPEDSAIQAAASC